MTTVGHALTGLTVAVVVMPPGRSWLWYLWAGHWFIGFANLPDFPVPYWGHSRYDISHSVFVTFAFAMVFVAATSMRRRLWAQLGTPIVAGYVVAWFSHLLLDSFYNHGRGIAIFWPLSEARLALPIPIFSVAHLDPFFTIHNATVCAIELAVYGSLFVIALAARRYLLTRGATPVAGT